MSYLRSCAGCSAHLLIDWHGPRDVLCKRCESKQPPLSEWIEAVGKGDLVYLQPYAAWRGLSSSKYLVVDHDADKLTVQVLGIPESRAVVNRCDIARQDMTPQGGAS